MTLIREQCCVQSGPSQSAKLCSVWPKWNINILSQVLTPNFHSNSVSTQCWGWHQCIASVIQGLLTLQKHSCNICHCILPESDKLNHSIPPKTFLKSLGSFRWYGHASYPVVCHSPKNIKAMLCPQTFGWHLSHIFHSMLIEQVFHLRKMKGDNLKLMTDYPEPVEPFHSHWTVIFCSTKLQS